MKIYLVFLLLIVSCSSEIKTKRKDVYLTDVIEDVYDLGTFRVKLKANKIIFDSMHGNISNPLKYNNLENEFNFNKIYKITNDLKGTFYFRFGWVSYNKDKNQTTFSNVKWINKKPSSTNFLEFKFLIVDIDFSQYGNISLCTIGDSQTWWSNAQNLRRLINKSYAEIVFVGSNTDIYGYGHDGEGGNSTSQVVKRVHKIPKADYYTLLIGTNDWKKDIQVAYTNTLGIINYLNKLNPKAKILYLTPIPTSNVKRDEFNTKLSKKLLNKISDIKQVLVVDLGGEMRKNNNWKSDYLIKDGLHQNLNGVKLMAMLIAEKIKKNNDIIK